jgi:hypothetical protein
MRAFMQRCEVRLSSIHRVATALLSGAGLIVIFPAVAKDSVARILRALISSGLDVPRVLLIAAELVAFALPLAALWLLLEDLTRFYFSGNHFDAGDSVAFYPRFALSGLRVARDELDPSTAAAVDAARRDPRLRAFLLPENTFSRGRADRQAAVYGMVRASNDDGRQDSLLELSTTRDRSLVEQVAGVEQVLARHVLNVQLLVLRYAKAVLAMLTTAGAAFAGAAVLDGVQRVQGGHELWLAAILMIWAPAVVTAVTAPVQWVVRVAMADGANDRAYKNDREFTLFEDIVVRLSTVSWVLASVAAIVVGRHARGAHLAAFIPAMVLSGVAFAITLARWDGKRAIRRLFGLHRQDV